MSIAAGYRRFLEQLSQRLQSAEAARLTHRDAAVFLAVIAAALTAAVILETTSLNVALFRLINDAGTVLPETIAWWVTSLGDGMTAAVIGLLFARRYPHILPTILVAAVLGGLITHIPKDLLALPRPAGVLDDSTIHIVGRTLRRGSMPSGHTLTAFTLAGVLVAQLSSGYARALVWLLAIIVGLSRIAVGAHWPADVCAGAAGGLVSAWLSIAGIARWRWLRSPGLHLALLVVLGIGAVTVVLRVFHSGYWELPAAAIAVVAIGKILRDYAVLLRPPGSDARSLGLTNR
jgi:membrane-associated phospholipid phosphatase